MKIVSWNCLDNFASKAEHIQRLNPDIVVVQECWPSDSRALSEWGYSGTEWRGAKGIRLSRGIIVFYRQPEIFNLIAVWSWKPESKVSRVKSESIASAQATSGISNILFRYTDVIRNAIATNESWFQCERVIVCGDFNSNCIWDTKKDGQHAAIVSDLKSRGLISAYHHSKELAQGDERDHTFFMNRKLTRSYHIDYVFFSEIWRERLTSCEVGQHGYWSNYSDHCPISIEIAM